MQFWDVNRDVNDKNYFFGQVNFQVDTCVCTFHYNANATDVSALMLASAFMLCAR